MINVLNVVQILQHVQHLLHSFGVLCAQLSHGIRNHGDFSHFHFNTSISQSLFYVIKGIRSGYDFKAFFFVFDILSASFQSNHHQVVLFYAGFLANCKHALLLEHVAYAAGSAQVAAVFAEYVTNVSSGTVTVIGEAANHHGYACRTIAFVGDFFKALAFQCACTLLDSALDVVLRNIVSLSLGQSQLQLHVTGGVSAAHAYSNGNLARDFSGNLAAQCVCFTLFMFNVCPFRMS